MPKFAEVKDVCVKDEICILCHMVRSLVEEATKTPYGLGWAHRDCCERAEKRLRTKKFFQG